MLQQLINPFYSKKNITHVQMYPKNGRYQLNNKAIDQLHNIIDTTADLQHGMLELPQAYSMFRIDVDTCKHTSKDIYNKVLKIQTLLRKHFDGESILECTVLEKPTYTKPNGKVSHGYHLQFHNLFIDAHSFKYLIEVLKKDDDQVDDITKNPWIMYGGSKNNYAGTYKITKIYSANGKVIKDINKHFLKYAVYNDRESKIIFKDDNIPFSRILSILPRGRLTSESHDCIFKTLERKVFHEEGYEKVDIVELTEDQFEKLELLYDNIPIEKWDNRLDWMNLVWVGLKLGLSNEYLTVHSMGSDKYQDDSMVNLIKTFDSSRVRDWKSNVAYFINISKVSSKEKNIIREVLEIPNERKIFKAVIDPFTSHELINTNNIGSYDERLTKGDLVFVKSCMNTQKTRNLHPLISGGKYRKILVVSYRVTLDKEYLRQLEQYGFQLYSAISKHRITSDRVIIQIDSLHRYHGSTDLLILDEICSTMDHLTSFTKEKQMNYDALTEHIQASKKAIICDAGLTDQHVNNLRVMAPKRTFHIVENIYKPFTNRVVKMSNVSSASTHFTAYVLKQLGLGKRVVCPVNSIKVVDVLFKKITDEYPDLVIAKITSMTEEPLSVEKWGSLDCLLYTPSISAGISYNDLHFDISVCYFTSRSCQSNTCTQMINRVRQLKSDEIYIFVQDVSCYLPTKVEEIEEHLYLSHRVNDIIQNKFKLQSSVIQQSFRKTAWYYEIVSHLQRENISKRNLSGCIWAILEEHGMVVTHDNEFFNDCSIVDLIPEITAIKANLKLEEAERITHADIIDKEEMTRISNLHNSSLAERDQVTLYMFKHHFNIPKGNEVTEEMYIDLSVKVEKYKRLCLATDIEYVEKLMNFEKGFVRRNDDVAKVFYGNRLIMACGYETIFDEDLIHPDYAHMVNFGKTYNDLDKILFPDSKPIKWDDTKTVLATRVYGRLSSIFGVCPRWPKFKCGNCTKGCDDCKVPYVKVLKGLECYKKHDIDFKCDYRYESRINTDYSDAKNILKNEI